MGWIGLYDRICEATRACLPQVGTARGFPVMMYHYIVPLDPAHRAGLARHAPAKIGIVFVIRRAVTYIGRVTISMKRYWE
jgi:hypothetical protein